VTTTEELLALHQTLATTLQGLDNLDEDALLLEKDVAEKLLIAQEIAAKLSKARAAALPKLEAEMAGLLGDVGMPNARFAIELSPAPLNAQGADQVRILFSANKGIAPQELKTGASGGEFSRLLLCLKYVLAGKTNLPTLIFDEIDTGISGEIALRVGRLMGRMAERHQLVVITHMPQIAAKGQQHSFVYKQEKAHRTSTHLRLLDTQDRLQEIAQMIGGANPTATALSSAKELMEAL
jgi:DNA repair protein RecN (Recombination protein N)